MVVPASSEFGLPSIRVLQNILDLTDLESAAEFGYEGGPISAATQAIGAKASEAGCDAIRFAAEQGGGANYAFLDNLPQLLSPQMITPIG